MKKKIVTIIAGLAVVTAIGVCIGVGPYNQTTLTSKGFGSTTDFVVEDSLEKFPVSKEVFRTDRTQESVSEDDDTDVSSADDAKRNCHYRKHAVSSAVPKGFVHYLPALDVTQFIPDVIGSWKADNCVAEFKQSGDKLYVRVNYEGGIIQGSIACPSENKFSVATLEGEITFTYTEYANHTDGLMIVVKDAEGMHYFDADRV